MPPSPAADKPEVHELDDALGPEQGNAKDDSTPVVDAALERLDRRVRWKLDLFILPVISSVYFFASMGRSDLANAKVAGMQEELGLSARAYSDAATMFLVSYIVFQLPGTLLVRQIGPPVQFCAAMVLATADAGQWGLFTTLSVLVRSTGALLAIRFLIGMAEAFVQGAVFYLSFFYKYNEMATRGAVFYSMATVAGAFNGLIAYAIQKHLSGAHGWLAWRWIFLIEGVLPMAFGFVVLVLLPPSPYHIRYGFRADEKAHVIARSAAAHNVAEHHTQWLRVPLVLLSPHFWLMTVVTSAGHFCVSSLTNFLPAIIKSFGYTSIHAQLFSVIVYACAAAGVVFWARIADTTNARSVTLASAMVGGIIGYAVLLGSGNHKVQFFATCLVAFCVYASIILQIAWGSMSFVGYTRRGSALALFNMFSQCAAIGATQAYDDPPRYRKGHSAALGMCAAGFVFSLLTRFYLQYANRQKRNMPAEKAARLRQKSVEEVGDEHPDFVYTI